RASVGDDGEIPRPSGQGVSHAVGEVRVPSDELKIATQPVVAGAPVEDSDPIAAVRQLLDDRPAGGRTASDDEGGAHRLSMKSWSSRSQVPSVTPSALTLYFSTRDDGFFGRDSTNPTYRGTAKYGRSRSLYLSRSAGDASNCRTRA